MRLETRPSDSSHELPPSRRMSVHVSAAPIVAVRRRVLALLGEKAALILKSSLHDSWDVHVLPELGNKSHSREWPEHDVIVVDPFSAVHDGRLKHSLSVLVTTSRTPVVFFASADFQSFKLLISICRAYPYVGVALWHSDGSTDGLEPALRRAVVSSLSSEVLRELLKRTSQPAGDRTARLLCEAFHHPTFVRSSRCIMELCGVTTATLNAELTACGLVSLRRIRAAAWVAHAYERSTRLGSTQERIVRDLSCGSVDTLNRAVKAVTGQTLSLLIKKRCRPEVLEAIVAFCLRSSTELRQTR